MEVLSALIQILKILNISLHIKMRTKKGSNNTFISKLFERVTMILCFLYFDVVRKYVDVHTYSTPQWKTIVVTSIVF